MWSGVSDHLTKVTICDDQSDAFSASHWSPFVRTCTDDGDLFLICTDGPIFLTMSYPHTAIKKQRKTSTNIYHKIYLFSLSFLFYFFLSLSLLSTLFVFLSYPNFLFLVGVVGFTKTSKGWGYRMNFNNILFLFLGGVWGTWGKER